MFAYQDAYIEQRKEQIRSMEASAYMNGIYNLRSILAALNGSKSPYPEKPMLIEKTDKVTEERELTEEEKIMYQKQLLMQLQIMQSNFETGNKK